MDQTVLIQGCGDVGSAAAHRLFGAGYRVVLHDDPRPAHTRRGMAFTNAIFEHKAELAGVLAKHQDSLEALERMLGCGRAVPVTTGDFGEVMEQLQPGVVVDARMRKRAHPQPLRGSGTFSARTTVPTTQRKRFPTPFLTIGLGPNFVVGKNADLAIETAWGADLGRVIERGATRPLEGEPQEIEGHARDRYVYAPASGPFTTLLEIGMLVRAGAEVARIGDIVLHAPLSGRLRGLTHSDVHVERGTKVIEVAPGEASAGVYGIGERPARIADGVLAALHGAIGH